MTSRTRSTPLRYAARFVPLLLRPRLRSFWNAHCRHGRISFANAVATVITALMMWGLYLCTHQALRDWSRLPTDRAMDVGILIAALLGALSAMIFLSSCVSAISSFYTSKEIDLLLASPISTRAFLLGKTWEVGFSAGWMLLTFLFPLYMAFGRFFAAGPLYYLLSPVVAGSLLVLAILFGVLCAILFTAIVPARSGRNICIFLFVAALGAFFASLNSSGGAGLALQSATNSLGISWQHPHQALTPIRFTGSSIVSLLHNQLGISGFVIAAHMAMCWALWRAIGWAHGRFFRDSYSRLCSELSAFRVSSRARRWASGWLFPRRQQARRALIAKDFFSFTRDITHTIQLAMLLTICLLYLYNFNRLAPPTHVGYETLRAWDIFLLITNFSLGSMVVLSICSRFIFPSVSMEGASLWIVQSAPISTRDFLRAKYSGWFLPVSVIATVIFTSGALAIGLEPLLIAATTINGLIITYGLISVAIGLGARFAQFDWDHSAQLTTSTGNLMYMLSGLALVSVSLIPAAVMFSAYVLLPNLFRDELHAAMLMGGTAVTIFLVNFSAARLALMLGTRAIERR